MTDEEEFSARSQLKWTREGDAWILLYRRRRMGRAAPAAARRYSRRWTLRLTPATLVAVRGRPTLASAVSRENSVTFAGDQLKEAGTTAQTRAVLTEANRLSFFMLSHRLAAKQINRLGMRPVPLILDLIQRHMP